MGSGRLTTLVDNRDFPSRAKGMLAVREPSFTERSSHESSIFEEHPHIGLDRLEGRQIGLACAGPGRCHDMRAETTEVLVPRYLVLRWLGTQ